jgi:hypothetical protein
MPILMIQLATPVASVTINIQFGSMVPQLLFLRGSSKGFGSGAALCAG